MIDAYKIGITLALNDEVSAGLGQIQRNLAATNQAVETATKNLIELQSLGKTTIEPTTAARPLLDISYQAAAKASDYKDLPTNAIDAPQALSAATLSERAPVRYPEFQAPPSTADSAPVSGPNSIIPDWSEFAATIVKPVTWQAADGVPVQAGPSLPPPVPEARPVPTVTAEPDKFAQIAQKTTINPAYGDARADIYPSPPHVEAPELKYRHSNHSVPDFASLLPPARQINAPAEDLLTLSSPVRSAVQDEAPRAQAPIWVPPAAARVEVTQESPQLPQSSTRMPGDTQIGTGTAEGRQVIEQGQLILDGTALGRWMMERLAREFTRPPSTMTMFDTRMTPLYGGPGIGV